MKPILIVLGGLVFLFIVFGGIRMNPTGTVTPEGALVEVTAPTGPVDPASTAALSRAATSPSRGSNPTSNNDPVLVGAGDIADCGNRNDEATAKLLDGIPGTVFTTGDNVYPNGSAREFADCYNPSWGRHKERTRPAPGNHDYRQYAGAAYYNYFGEAAGNPDKGYYSYNLGEWHIVVINSNCNHVGCEAGSHQERWLRTDLAQYAATCTLAYWHHPRFSSGKHGSDPKMQHIWAALYEAGADVVLSGHDHNYQRFAPLNARGDVDLERGIRQFVVGTGGKSHYEIHKLLPNTEAYNDDTYGVLKLTLHDQSYDWEFVPVEGATFTDSGSGVCHR